MYGALPEDHDRHEGILRVQTEEIHRHSLALGDGLLQFYPTLCAELREAFVLSLLDLGDEELPEELQYVVVLDIFFAVDAVLPNLQKRS